MKYWESRHRSKTMRSFKPHYPHDKENVAELVAWMSHIAELSTLGLVHGHYEPWWAIMTSYYTFLPSLFWLNDRIHLLANTLFFQKPAPHTRTYLSMHRPSHLGTRMHAHTQHLSLTSRVHVTCHYTRITETCAHSRTNAEEERGTITSNSWWQLSFTLDSDAPVCPCDTPFPWAPGMTSWWVQGFDHSRPIEHSNRRLSNWIWSMMGVPTVTGCLCVQDCWTALISAAKEGQIEVVRELLENNANLEHRDMVRT